MTRPTDAEQLTREQIERIRATFRMFGVGEEQRSRLSVLCDMALASLSATPPIAPAPPSNASAEYARKNPLGGPAKMFEAMAARIRAGEDYYAVLADYGLAVNGGSSKVSDEQLAEIKDQCEIGLGVEHECPAMFALAAIYAELFAASPSSQLQPSSTGNEESKP